MKLCRSGPNKRKFILCSGPRRSSKTVGCMNAIAEHALVTSNTRMTVVAPSVTAAADGGVWADLCDMIMPMWINADFGMEWVTRPRQEGTTKKLFFEVSNMYGNISRVQLDALNNEDEVEKRFKGKRFSMIYVAEMAETLRKRRSFDVLIEALRMPHLRPDQHTFLGDTNPGDEGEDSWIHQLWYQLRNDEECDPDIIPLRDQLELIEINIGDNPYLTESEVALLKAQYMHDPDLYARYIEGKWTRSSRNSLFSKHFIAGRHVIGELATPANPNPSIMVPEEDCYSLGTGWDLGIVNSAAAVIEKWHRLKKGSEVKTEVCFKILDELNFVGEDFAMRDFILEFWEKMKFWEEFMEKKLQWHHWSDSSAFDRKEPIAMKYHHEEVFDVSDGEIRLKAADKKSGSVQRRIDLAKKLLWENRLFVSANCPATIDMFKALKAGSSITSPIQKGSKHKHIFDAIMYHIGSEMALSMWGADRTPNKAEPSMISVAL